MISSVKLNESRFTHNLLQPQLQNKFCILPDLWPCFCHLFHKLSYFDDLSFTWSILLSKFVLIIGQLTEKPCGTQNHFSDHGLSWQNIMKKKLCQHKFIFSSLTKIDKLAQRLNKCRNEKKMQICCLCFIYLFNY